MVSNRKDILWKPAIEDFFDYLLYFFFPELAGQIDFKRGFDFLDKEMGELFPSENPEYPKFIDKLIRVYLKSGREKWFLVHIEVQGYRQKIFPERMFRYFYRIWDKYNRDIVSLAIYLDKKRSSNSQMYKYRVGDTRLDFDFKKYYVGDQKENDLYKSANPFALVVLTALIGLKKGLKDEQLLELKFSLVKRLMQIRLSREKIHRLLRFINSYLNFKYKETNIKFAERIEPVTAIKNTHMGIFEVLEEEAKKRGLREGKRKGRIEGIKEGKIKGIKEGTKMTLLSTAKKMLEERASMSFVHKCTGLSKKQLAGLIKSA